MKARYGYTKVNSSRKLTLATAMMSACLSYSAASLRNIVSRNWTDGILVSGSLREALAYYPLEYFLAMACHKTQQTQAGQHHGVGFSLLTTGQIVLRRRTT